MCKKGSYNLNSSSSTGNSKQTITADKNRRWKCRESIPSSQPQLCCSSWNQTIHQYPFSAWGFLVCFQSDAFHRFCLMICLEVPWWNEWVIGPLLFPIKLLKQTCLTFFPFKMVKHFSTIQAYFPPSTISNSLIVLWKIPIKTHFFLFGGKLGLDS